MRVKFLEIYALSKWTEFHHFQPLEHLGKDVGEFPDHISLFGYSVMDSFSMTEHAYEAFAISVMSLGFLDFLDNDPEKAFEFIMRESKNVLFAIYKEAGPSPIFISVEEQTSDVISVPKKYLIFVTISLILLDLGIDRLKAEKFGEATPLVADAILLCWRAQAFMQSWSSDFQKAFTEIESKKINSILNKLRSVQRSGGEARALKYQPAREWVAKHDDPQKWEFATTAARELTPGLWQFLEKSEKNPFPLEPESAIERRVEVWVGLHRKGLLL